MVFSDGAQLRRLNAIVHPLVSERMLEKERSAPPGSVLVHDVPLLTENGLAGLYDVVIVVDVPEEVQLDRLTRLRGLDPDQAKARLAAQASRDQRLAIADIVIDNSGSLAALDHQVADLWSRLTNQADEKK
jgi:dephospho-CoA kinase